VASLLSAALACSGCIGARIVYPVMPTAEELLEFEAAGPDDFVATDLDVAAMQVSGPYHVVEGDLLTIELPPEVQLDDSSGEGAPAGISLRCRVKERSGSVLLPMIGEQPVVGKTTAEIERDLAEAFKTPTSLLELPNVVVTVSEYRTTNVVVIGAVNAPGMHELRSDRMTVIGALMEAGGIKTDRGVRAIRVIGKGPQGETLSRTLPVSSDVPLADLALQGQETIVVEPTPQRSFTVYGLVKRSGIFDYPQPRRFNLMQALATAGGVDEVAAPRYATIYRKRADGSVLGATFKIDGTSLEAGSNVVIKDGDVIAVEHTQGSWLRQFLSGVLGFRASVNVTGTASPTL